MAMVAIVEKQKKNKNNNNDQLKKQTLKFNTIFYLLFPRKQ